MTISMNTQNPKLPKSPKTAPGAFSSPVHIVGVVVCEG